MTPPEDTYRGWDTAEAEAEDRAFARVSPDPLESLVVIPPVAGPELVHEPADDGEDWDLLIHKDGWR